MGRTIQVYGFPFIVTREEVKEFLEQYTGKGTVDAVEIGKRKTINPNQRVAAVVQFTSAKNAELISSLINRSQRLYYGNSYLKVQDWKPKVSRLNIKASVLHFGCQVSDDRFSVLWKQMNVAVEFGFEFRKLFFTLSHSGVDYKLELSYDSIWQIQLRRPQRQNVQFLVIQVLAAPRIYEKTSGDMLWIPMKQVFWDTLDDQWVRTTDFSPSCSIGHSSAMCLELPYSCELPNFSKNFPCYKEDKGRFVLESGSAFSPSLDLVPFVGLPREIDLPFNILFKVNSLVQNGCLAGPIVNARFFTMVNPSFTHLGFIERALEKLYHLKECCYEPVKWLSEQYLTYQRSKNSPKESAISLSNGLVYVRRVQVTPSKVYFCGPEINVSNRVLRQYPEYIDNFIRVSFVDEDWDKILATDLSARSISTSRNEGRSHTRLYKRILTTMKNGIVIGDKKFDFLAFSSSQLQESSAWMFASTDSTTAATIREWMGDFRDIRNVAKYAARLGQSFGSSTETLSVGSHEFEIIPDVEIESNGVKYLFSDGIGKISSEFAHRVARKCGIESTPSAFQIRYGGYKGVVAVDPTSQMKLSLRNSMCKFKSTNTKLDVLSWSKFQPCFLNRQVITLLSTLGVGDHVFEKQQKEAVDQLDLMLTNPVKALEVLEIMSPAESTNVLKEMLLCGYMPDQEPYLSMILQTFRASKLLGLRTKSRIFVPKARSMIGCMDETRTLEYGEVFVQYSNRKQLNEDSLLYGGNNESQIGAYVVVGKVVVAKNPCLHPGDMRVLKAVNIPALYHMVDCIVFPQKGKRPHPNECSGSDLDGDIYFVCWDPELIPPRQVQPMDYTAAPIVDLDHDVRIEEVQEYFTNYMVNVSLGVISNTHTAFADKSELMAESKECKELARLFSIAVDFPKTGVPAEIPSDLHVEKYPDFMEKLDKPTYESQRVIGKLFREVKDIAPRTSPVKSFTREVARKSYDPDMEVEGFKDYLDDAEYYKGEYDHKLGNLMDYFGIKTEAEILGGSIMKLSKSFKLRRDVEAISKALKALKNEARTWFDEKHHNSDYEADHIYAKASAWYHVTYHPRYWGCYNDDMKRDHFLSFPWCVYDKLIRIKRKNCRINRS